MCIIFTLTLIVSDGEVWIDVLLRDHGEVEVVSLHGLVRIHGTQQLNELRHKDTRWREIWSTCPMSLKIQSAAGRFGNVRRHSDDMK